MWEIRPTSENIPNLRRYHSIASNWKFSADKIQALRSLLNDRCGQFGPSLTIAVAGSLGRFEAAGASDLDCLVLSDDVDIGAQALRILREVAVDLNFSLPKNDGVFSEAASLDTLVADVGSFSEQLGGLGRRMLILLESFPVYNINGFDEAINKIFQTYGHHVQTEGHKQFIFLLNYAVRYFRSICVNYQNNFWRENEKWPLRNIKLRHSRIVMYAGLLLTLGSASKLKQNRYDFVKNRMRFTPLERIAHAYSDAEDDCFFRVAGCYDIFLSRLSNPTTRTDLLNVDYEHRYDSVIFSELKSNSDALVSELTRFIFSRRGVWSERFFEYLMF